MTTPIPQNTYVAASGTSSTGPFLTISVNRAPTANDVNFPVGKRWINIANANDEYFLLNFTSSAGVVSANWVLLGGGSGIIQAIAGNTGGDVGPDGSGTIHVIGDGTTITIAGNPGTSTLTASLIAGGVAIETINGDTGSITPTGGVVTIRAGTSTLNSGSSVSFNNSGSISTLNVTDSNQNTIIGKAAGSNSLIGGANVVLGRGAFSIGTTSSGNTIIGNLAAQFLITGNFNTILGNSAGNSYTSSESANILIGAQSYGLPGDSNTLRLGASSGLFAINKAFVAGITGVTPTTGNTPQVVLCDNAGQLTTISSSTSGFVLTSNGTATPSFQAPASASSSLAVTVYTSGSGTYTTPAGAYALVVEMVGGGGGGGAGSVTGTNGGNGGATTFGASLLTANPGALGLGGSTGTIPQLGGAGGTATGGDINLTGGTGGTAVISETFAGVGGSSVYGGAGTYGTGGSPTTAGGSASPNTGSGGGGGGSTSVPGQIGAGGGAGGFLKKTILTPLSSYAYAVGAGGAGGTGGLSAGGAGGAGASGMISITAYIA